MKHTLIAFMALFIFLVGCTEDSNPEELLANPTPEEQECGTTHELVGQTRALRVSQTYGISGDVTIVSDCEIQFTNFFYNGSGPAVSIYGATDGDFDSGINLSNTINGRVFRGETLTVFLPEGTSLDEINSFSVWCFQFNIDFSSVQF